MYINNHLFLPLLRISFYFLPVSFVIGSLVVNLNIILFLILGFIFLFLDKIKIRFNLTNLVLLSFFIVSILSSLINIDTIGEKNFYKSIFLLRFYFLYILIETLIFYKKIDIKYFLHACYALIIFISLDLALQFFLGVNILGYEPWEGRITGIFEHEAIAGSFLQKVYIFSLISIFLIFYQNNKDNNNYKVILSLIIIIFASYIASNRISFLILISLNFFLIIFFKKFRKNLIISLITLIPVFYYYYNNNEQINLKYKGFTNKIGGIIKFDNLANFSDKKEIPEGRNIEIKSNLPNHLKIYITSYKSFKENMVLGNGIKSFRYNCKNFLNQKNTLCSTHPHNYHLEVLHDSGLVGFISLSVFVILLLWNKIKLIFNHNYSFNQKIILSLLILNFLIEIFPFKSTGSFFTTWNGSLLWISIALLNVERESQV
tara:strand:- start:282 stop:1574 length:1293 start_codon:yes stop_codon:yes gene_type:complete